MSRARFELEWVLPQESGLMTHVTLFDGENPPHSSSASATGGTKPTHCSTCGLRSVTGTKPSEANAFVAAAYMRWTGREPERPTN